MLIMIFYLLSYYSPSALFSCHHLIHSNELDVHFICVELVVKIYQLSIYLIKFIKLLVFYRGLMITFYELII